MRSMSLVVLALKLVLLVASAGCGNDPGHGTGSPDSMVSADLDLPGDATDAGTPPDGPRLPDGVACAVNGPWPIGPCAPKNDCRVCMAIFGAPQAGVCIEPCSTTLQDCSGGRTCRPRSAPPYAWFAAGLGCGDGYCE